MFRAAIAAGLATIFFISLQSGSAEARGGLPHGVVGGSHPWHMTSGVWSRHMPPSFERHFGMRDEHKHRFAFWHNGRRFNLELPLGYGGYYDPYGDLVDETAVGTVEPSPLVESPYQYTAVAGTDHGRGCQSQAQWVPGRNGMVRVVVTRC